MSAEVRKNGTKAYRSADGELIGIARAFDHGQARFVLRVGRFLSVGPWTLTAAIYDLVSARHIASIELDRGSFMRTMRKLGRLCRDDDELDTLERIARRNPRSRRRR